MTYEPMLEELRGKLEEADSLPEEDRAMLTKMLGQLREVCMKMAQNPAIGQEAAARKQEELRGHWLTALEACKAVDVAESELVEKCADRADAVRTLSIMMLRRAHSTKQALDEGTFTGTWEQREALMEMVRETEERRESLLEDLTAEDIRQLEAEGVLYDR